VIVTALRIIAGLCLFGGIAAVTSSYSYSFGEMGRVYIFVSGVISATCFVWMAAILEKLTSINDSLAVSAEMPSKERLTKAHETPDLKKSWDSFVGDREIID